MHLGNCRNPMSPTDSFDEAKKEEPGKQPRLYTVTGWSEMMNFTADCDASAICHTHSVHIAPKMP